MTGPSVGGLRTRDLGARGTKEAGPRTGESRTCTRTNLPGRARRSMDHRITLGHLRDISIVMEGQRFRTQDRMRPQVIRSIGSMDNHILTIVLIDRRVSGPKIRSPDNRARIRNPNYSMETSERFVVNCKSLFAAIRFLQTFQLQRDPVRCGGLSSLACVPFNTLFFNLNIGLFDTCSVCYFGLMKDIVYSRPQCCRHPFDAWWHCYLSPCPPTWPSQLASRLGGSEYSDFDFVAILAVKDLTLSFI